MHRAVLPSALHCIMQKADGSEDLAALEQHMRVPSTRPTLTFVQLLQL